MKTDQRALNGILLFDKPAGLSSNQALQRVKRLFQAEKAGHAGTLDPMATGLLPILFGEASKFAQSGLDANKQYEAVMKLGIETTTGDATGTVLSEHAVPPISPAQLLTLEQNFLGPQQQVPPMYSALKKQGVPLYRLARAGTVIERPPRHFVVHRLSLTQIDAQHIRLQVFCSKGTYVRTLAEDIARAIDCKAHLIALRRTAVGHLSQPLHSLEFLESIANDVEHLSATLLPVDSFLNELARIHLNKAQCQALFQGKKISQVTPTFPDQTVCLYTEQGRFCGIGSFDTAGDLISKRLVNPAYIEL